MTKVRQGILRWSLFGALLVRFGICVINFEFFGWAAGFPAAAAETVRRRHLAELYGALFLMCFVAAVIVLVLNIRWHRRDQ